MKKSIIALAVAGAMAAPIVAQADATLYGAVSVDYINKEVANNDKGYFQLDDSYIGVKASHELEGGLTSAAQVEYADSGAGLTYANASLSGDFGTAVAGLIANPINDVTTDALGTSDSQEWGDATADEIVAAAYMTPDMGGFSAYAGFTADADGAADENTADAGMIGVKYSAAGFSAHLGYLGSKANAGDPVLTSSSSVTGLKLGYAVDALSLTGVYTKVEVAGDEAVKSMGFGAGYDLGATDLYLFHVQDDVAGAEKAKTTGVKASYALGTGTSAYAEWSKTSDIGGTADLDGKAVTIGYKVAF